MSVFTSRPNSSLIYWIGNTYWQPIPTTSFAFHYTRVDEGMANKSNSDYWRAVIGGLPERNLITVQSNAPAGLGVGTDLEFDIYWKSTEIVAQAGVRLRVYYDRHDVPSATAGTNTLNVYSTTGEFASAAPGDLLYNYTRSLRSQIFVVHSSNRVELQFGGVAGQAPGDHVDYINLKHSRKYHINSSGQWKTYRLTVPAVGVITKAELNDMEIALVGVAGDGGEIPQEIL